MAIHNAAALDLTFRALGDASRRTMVETLSRRGPCSAGTLVELFDLAQPTVSKHLKVLERAALVERDIRGRSHLFTMRNTPLKEAHVWLGRHLAFWENSLDRLDTFLGEGGERQ